MPQVHRPISAGGPAGATLTSSVIWGLFAASSWTWCIGMFLPVLLLERAGWSAFLAFAIPNVIGCAALGFLFRSATASERFTRRHADAAVLFSAATIAFHLFFACFFILSLAPRFGSLLNLTQATDGNALTRVIPALATGFVILAAGRLLSVLGDRTWAYMGTACWCISIGVLLVIIVDPSRLGDLTPRFGTGHALLLAPVAAFGFLLCPYLDLTFHRARQRSGTHHSSIVLGAGFAAMLVVTIIAWFRDVNALGFAVMLHLSMQSIFTVGAHLREIRTHAPHVRSDTRYALPGIMLLGPLAGLLLVVPIGGHPLPGETIYLWFLAAYGLIFPAYVLVFAAPRIAIARTPRSLGVFTMMILLAAPLYEIGFVRERPVALLAPMLVAAAFIALRLAGSRMPHAATMREA